jgi:hypothetical protein
VGRAGKQVWIRDIEARLNDLDRKFSRADWNRHVKALDELIFKGYHFTITSIDSLGMKEYAKSRERWKQMDELHGRTKSAIERIRPEAEDAVAMQIGHYVENAKPLMGPM